MIKPKLCFTTGVTAVLCILLSSVSFKASVKKGFFIENNIKTIDVYYDGKLFTSYTQPDGVKKPILYPIISPNGNFITRGWPLNPRPDERIDHPHQVGFWFNYGDVNGYDFWNNSVKPVKSLKGPFGTILFKSIKQIDFDKNTAVLEVVAEWQADSKPLIEETTKFIFLATANERIIDRMTTLKALSDVNLGDNKEGLAAIRVATELEQASNDKALRTDENGKENNTPNSYTKNVSGLYESSDGKTGDDVFGTSARWVKLSGIIQQENINLILMDHPENIGFPAHWFARGYGLFGVNNLAQNAYDKRKPAMQTKIAKGNSVVFKHRLIINNTAITTQNIENEYQQFIKNTK